MNQDMQHWNDLTDHVLRLIEAKRYDQQDPRVRTIIDLLLSFRPAVPNLPFPDRITFHGKTTAYIGWKDQTYDPFYNCNLLTITIHRRGYVFKYNKKSLEIMKNPGFTGRREYTNCTKEISRGGLKQFLDQPDNVYVLVLNLYANNPEAWKRIASGIETARREEVAEVEQESIDLPEQISKAINLITDYAKQQQDRNRLSKQQLLEEFSKRISETLANDYQAAERIFDWLIAAHPELKKKITDNLKIRTFYEIM